LSRAQRVDLTCAACHHPCCRMWAADRIVGNTLEWGLVFLPLYWIAMVVTGGTCAVWGWV